MELKLDGCMLRSWEKADAVPLQKHANNRKIWSNLRDVFPHPYTLEDARWWISQTRTVSPESSFAIATEKEIIGGIGLIFLEDVHRFSAELGYWLAEPYWGQGFMTIAVKSMTEFSFNQYPLMRIFACPFSHNIASQRVLEKAGYQLEGIMRKHVIKDGRILDQMLYAITDLRFHDHLPEVLGFAG